jgi:predicted Zn-dependent protease
VTAPAALRRATPVALALLLTLARGVAAQTPLETARALLNAWHEEPARIDRARALLEMAAATDPNPETLVELSRAWMLTGEFRATIDGDRAAAFERGAEAARRASAAAPRNERAHLLRAFNTGRAAQLKGGVRAAALLSTIREESTTVLRINPASVDGLLLAAGLAADLPTLMGGDRARAEMLFVKALELDPHHTGGRIELARLLLASRRWSEATRELQRVLDETAPTERPRWVMSDAPRAAAMLRELQTRGYVPVTTQSP